jgi:DMSO/TMAO reductase YedYZ molybdopterin-dependent catalytic subunit
MKTQIFYACSAILLILSAGCGGSNAQSLPDYQPRELESVEVNQYEGEKLSSSGEFRDNSIRGPQYIDLADYSLEIKGLVDNPISLSYEEIIALENYKKVVTLNCVEGWSVKILWEGVRVKDLLNMAGIDHRAKTVVFHCHDGFWTNLSLNHVMIHDILLAHKMNEIVLPEERGFPFHLVAEQKWGYKWAKWVTAIELADSDEGKGYWERSGYSDDGDLDKSFFD